MFAYCLNNPVCNFDETGSRSKPYLVRHDVGAGYIYDQEKEPYSSNSLGNYPVSYNGCGAIASYNALVSLGDYTPLSEILSYFNASSSRMNFDGQFGIFPWQIATYFKSLGYNATLAYTAAGIDAHSSNADACILFYMFPREDTLWGIEGTWPGAHYIEYSSMGSGYIGRNTGGLTGMMGFDSPAEYGYDNANFYAIGIFIYK